MRWACGSNPVLGSKPGIWCSPSNLTSHPQAAQALAADQFGSPNVGVAGPTLSFRPERDPNCQARNGDPLVAPANFRAYWRWKSRPGVGRPPINPEIRGLIRQISMVNPLWGAPRIHGELLMANCSCSGSAWNNRPSRNIWWRDLDDRRHRAGRPSCATMCGHCIDRSLRGADRVLQIAQWSGDCAS
jgi:hypothetical protein